MKQVFDTLGQQQALDTARWLRLAVLALAIAGLFALLLVISRVPGMERLFPWIDFFHTALVIHVNQSVLVWFLALAGVICSLARKPQSAGTIGTRLAYWLTLAGTLGIALSAFVDDAKPLINNYIPVLQHPLFFLALGCFACGLILYIGQFVSDLSLDRILRKGAGPVYLVALTISIIFIIALGALAWGHWPGPLGECRPICRVRSTLNISSGEWGIYCSLPIPR